MTLTAVIVEAILVSGAFLLAWYLKGKEDQVIIDDLQAFKDQLTADMTKEQRVTSAEIIGEAIFEPSILPKEWAITEPEEPTMTKSEILQYIEHITRAGELRIQTVRMELDLIMDNKTLPDKYSDDCWDSLYEQWLIEYPEMGDEHYPQSGGYGNHFTADKRIQTGTNNC